MTTSEKIKVMQAYVDGSDIEYCAKGDDVWGPAPAPCWDWIRANFRVKVSPPLIGRRYKYDSTIRRVMGKDGEYIIYKPDVDGLPFNILSGIRHLHLIGHYSIRSALYMKIHFKK